MHCLMHGDRARTNTEKIPDLGEETFYRGKIDNINAINKANKERRWKAVQVQEMVRGAEVWDFNRFHLPIVPVQPILSETEK